MNAEEMKHYFHNIIVKLARREQWNKNESVHFHCGQHYLILMLAGLRTGSFAKRVVSGKLEREVLG